MTQEKISQETGIQVQEINIWTLPVNHKLTAHDTHLDLSQAPHPDRLDPHSRQSLHHNRHFQDVRLDGVAQLEGWVSTDHSRDMVAWPDKKLCLQTSASDLYQHHTQGEALSDHSLVLSWTCVGPLLFLDTERNLYSLMPGAPPHSFCLWFETQITSWDFTAN